jgi:hypothetical protein
VLGTGTGVEVEVLVDLAALLGDRRLVERELHPVVAIGDHLGHQGGVVGGDVVADELGHVHEAHDLVVEGHPVVHLAELDVAHDVIEGLEEPLGRALALDEATRAGDIPGDVRAGIPNPVDHELDEGVPGLAVGRDRRQPDGAELVLDVVRLLEDRRARHAGPARCTVDVRDLEADVDNTVAVRAWWAMSGLSRARPRP